jgi:hypothetical protein
LLDIQPSVHLEAKAIAVADLVDRHRPDRFGHGPGVAARPDLVNAPAPVMGRLTVVEHPLNQG